MHVIPYQWLNTNLLRKWEDGEVCGDGSSVKSSEEEKVTLWMRRNSECSWRKTM